MKAVWATICDRFVDTDAGVDLYGVELDMLTILEELPAGILVNVAVSIVVERHEFGTGGHQLTVRLLNPQLEPLASATFPFNIGPPGRLHPAHQEGHVMHHLEIPLLARQEGVYVILITADDQAEAITLQCGIRSLPEPE